MARILAAAAKIRAKGWFRCNDLFARAVVMAKT